MSARQPQPPSYVTKTSSPRTGPRPPPARLSANRLPQAGQSGTPPTYRAGGWAWLGSMCFLFCCFVYVPRGVACVLGNELERRAEIFCTHIGDCHLYSETERERMQLYMDTEVDGLSQLMESGDAVNSPGDALGQTPSHLAACGGHAYFLLWQLQTGVDINQQDLFGETLAHKAARSGSMECLSLLVAHDARLDVYNRDGHTAEDLALSGGFLECAKYLSVVKHTQDTFSRARSSVQDLKEPGAGVKRAQNSLDISHGKRRRSDAFI